MRRGALPTATVAAQPNWPKRWLDHFNKGRVASASYAVTFPETELRRVGHLPSGGRDALHVREEFRIIKRSLLMNALDRSKPEGRDTRVILVTSAVPNEGRSFVAQNLAMSLAIERDLAVTLIDGDVSGRGLTRKFGLGGAEGLLDALDSNVADPSAVSEETNISNLAFIPAGRARSDSAELLSSVRMGDLIKSLLASPNRFVVIDSAPVLSGGLSFALASHAGQFVFVISANETRRADIDEALTLLDAAVGPLEESHLGLVLNNVSATQSAARYSAHGR